ncbi:MAG: hypothetical protein ACRDZ9_07040, partial [Acidimicrobiales bacterium]
MQPVVGALVVRRGSRPLVAAAPLYMAAVVLPALAVDLRTLLLATVAVGAGNGALDIAMNAQGLAVERAAHVRLFNSLHAAFSFGALPGAVAAGVAAGMGVAPLPHLAAWAAGGAVAAGVTARGLLPADADARAHGARTARPTPRLAAIGVIAFCALLAEGAVFDWSSIYLATVAMAPQGLASMGLAAFSLSMGLGRLLADRASAVLGSVPVAAAGALLAALGLGAALVLVGTAGGIAGFMVMGLGLSAVFPLALRAAALSQDDSGPALAAVSAVGYVGFLAGPPAIGVLAGRHGPAPCPRAGLRALRASRRALAGVGTVPAEAPAAARIAGPSVKGTAREAVGQGDGPGGRRPRGRPGRPSVKGTAREAVGQGDGPG